jgi:hypothetical protein
MIGSGIGRWYVVTLKISTRRMYACVASGDTSRSKRYESKIFINLSGAPSPRGYKRNKSQEK